MFRKLRRAYRIIISLHRNQERIMSKLDELKAAADALQASLDAEQEQMLAALASLQATIDTLNAQLADGATPEQLQEIIDKLNATKSDLEATI